MKWLEREREREIYPEVVYELKRSELDCFVSRESWRSEEELAETERRLFWFAENNVKKARANKIDQRNARQRDQGLQIKLSTRTSHKEWTRAKS